MIWFIFGYLLLLIGIGLFSKKLIKTGRDYLLAGQSLPLSLSTFALFATWFGSETILGATDEVLKGGFVKVIEEPFGAALCLILAGFLIVKPIYRMGLTTFGDFFRVKYGEKVEILATLMLIISYFGWIAAQFVAFGLIFKAITNFSFEVSILIGFFIVLILTYLGGMWAIALTDFIQTIVIIFSILFVFFDVIILAGGFSAFKKIPPSYYSLIPELNYKDIIMYIAGLITISLGSIPGQELFQRYMSSKSEDVAFKSSILAGLMYLTVALIPLFTVLIIKFSLGFESKNTLIDYISLYTNDYIKTIFFAGLMSAILSTASAAILAPSALLSNNILPKIFKTFSESALLTLSRSSVLIISIISLLLAFSGESIYQLVATSSIITLVSLFSPFILGIYWSKSNKAGAVASIIIGFLTWFFVNFLIGLEYEAVIVGFLVNVLSMVLFSLLFKET
ncbi:sodium:solute symporter family protein [Sulfurihydrogenibium subterraneum]|uniref:sodium:solute symporter family protein n=1 Tax=Sulfurihydrogenibium subterraneum TaxID=171121 RepID=UPI000491D302|nr:sodium:solute symporter family protein [Sulfurihydrogenibium subterraneum]